MKTLRMHKNMHGLSVLALSKRIYRIRSAVKRKMKTVFSMYTGIILVTLTASAVQLNLLSNGVLLKQNSPEFKSQIVLAPTTTLLKNEAVSFKPTKIVIDSIGIDLPVVSVPLKNGTWEVNPGVANYAEETSLINEKGGNVGIYAHDRVDGFTKIRQLAQGYDIILYGNNYKATYKVEKMRVINPSDVNVFYPTKEPTVTLTTCDGLFSEKRYMVQAKLVKIEKLK